MVSSSSENCINNQSLVQVLKTQTHLKVSHNHTTKLNIREVIKADSSQEHSKPKWGEKTIFVCKNIIVTSKKKKTIQLSNSAEGLKTFYIKRKSYRVLQNSVCIQLSLSTGNIMQKIHIYKNDQHSKSQFILK